MHQAQIIFRFITLIAMFKLMGPAHIFFGEYSPIVVLLIGIVLVFTVSDFFGILFFGLFLCCIGKSKEIRKWANPIAYDRKMEKKAVFLLKAYATK